MADMILVREEHDRRGNAVGTVYGGDCHQLADGRAAYVDRLNVAENGDPLALKTTGQVVVTKTSGVVFLDGGRVYWDHSANSATFRKVNDRDFYIGRCVGDATSTSTTCIVNLNVNPTYDIDLIDHDAALSVATGTAAAGGFGLPSRFGAAVGLSLTATSEAQCVDFLSVDRFALGANAIAEFIVRLGANGSTNAVDFNIGIANGTSTTDADAITESVFFHIDGNALDIFAESDDGTTEVNATDTTIDATAGSAVANRFEFWIDMRNPADIQLYINGVNVLPSTVFTLAAATGPLGLLAHLEKTSSTATAGPVFIDRACVRYAEN
jgi:hypothetical protein